MNIQHNRAIDKPALGNRPETSGPDELEKFIYLLSHDVRNSARALLEVPQWIEEDLIDLGYPVEGALAENIKLMNTHTRRLDRMLVDLLTFSRVGRKQTQHTVDLEEAVQMVLAQISLPHGFTVNTDLAQLSVDMGERDILTLLGELITNSAKHHHRDRGSIALSARRDGGDLVIRARDDGPGITEKYRDRVFEAMITLKPRDEVEGSGMGLAIVRKIVQHYGGTLRWCMEADDASADLEIRLPT
ncbi:hypothetical protein A9Q95_11215 [Rhodobacterales bacterium 59_46_T64]|nr:hypothetical protein A9Q95_11215 [Rhodobacterales bacterium 59_46_T64]